MKIKTSELTGAALDWAVGYVRCLEATDGKPILARDLMSKAIRNGMASPSTDWAQGGPIIEREMREFGFDLWSGAHVPTGQFAATYCRGAPDSYVYGPTPLVAAMRCYCCAKLGDEIDIPEELCQQQSS